jgi:hypothetical protein
MTALVRIGDDMCRSILQYCSPGEIRTCLITCKTFLHASQHKMTYKFATFEISRKETIKLMAESPSIRPYVQSIKGLKWSAKMHRCLRAFNHLTHLNLEGVTLGCKGAERLVNMPTLKVLNLCGTNLGNEGFIHIYRCLPHLPHLTNLNLKNCSIYQIKPLINLPLISLNLADNPIKWEEAYNLHFPMFTASLLELDLSFLLPHSYTYNYHNNYYDIHPCILSSLPPNLIKLTLSTRSVFPYTDDIILPLSLKEVVIHQTCHSYQSMPNVILHNTFGKLKLIEAPVNSVNRIITVKYKLPSEF